MPLFPLKQIQKKTWECRTKVYLGLLESQLKQGVTKLRGNCGEKRGQKSTKKMKEVIQWIFFILIYNTPLL